VGGGIGALRPVSAAAGASASIGRSALIGHTGFVGSNLLRQRPFDRCYNSSNIESIAGESFDLVVCAGVRAEKWIANANPDADWERIDRLVAAVDAVSARRFVLISTVDVFAVPREVDEDTPIDLTGAQPYGVNRRRLEEHVASRFEALIVRLPGLYGRGLKKNVIHDLLADHEVHKIDSRGVFQFYGLDRLWGDVETAMQHSLPLVHLVTEPVSVRDVALHAFGIDFHNEVLPQPARYDLRTRHAALFGGEPAACYIERRDQELDAIRRYVETARAERRR
jgi:hypothetical protein